MEKCTYCVQRINAARIDGREARTAPIRDGEVVTACQAACPTQAIVFGNMNDPNSRGRQAEGRAAQLRAAGRAEHAAAHDLPGGGSQPESRTAETAADERTSARRHGARRGSHSTASRSARRRATTPPVIAPGHTLRVGHRQDQRDRADARARRAAGSSASRIALRPADASCCWRSAYLFVEGRRHLGHQHPGRLGLRHHQLRLVDRHRPRRHADLGDSAAAAASSGARRSTASPRR